MQPLPVANADPVMCCLAMTASCLACASGVSVSEYCQEHPDTVGCSSPPGSRRKLLCLHGGGGTGPGFEQGFALSALSAEFDLVFPTAPQSGLWMRDPPGGKGSPTEDEEWASVAVGHLDEIVRSQGPFYGILGYSQGAAFVPVYLAHVPSGTFQIAALFCGYLPTTHNGLVRRINALAPFDGIASLHFMARNDPIITTVMGDEVAARFTSPVVLVSPTAGHALPSSSDLTYSSVLDFFLSLPPPALGCEDGDDDGLECGGGICRAREYCSSEIFGVPVCDGVLSGKPQFPPWDCLDREPPPWCSACDGEWRLPGPACIPCGAIGGRPYVVEGRSRLPKVVASSEWSYASADPLPAAQENVSCPGVSPFAVTAEVRRLAGQYWVSAGAAEWASVASFSKHSLELIAHGAPAHLLSGVHSAALEEVRHAEAAYAIASSYLGVQVGPSTLETRDSCAAGSLSDLACSTAREACVAETLAAIEARLTLAACKVPAACAALAVVARDEVPSWRGYR